MLKFINNHNQIKKIIVLKDLIIINKTKFSKKELPL
jgi:hypothetical protein